MLVLSRCVGEKIEIGDGITVTILRITGKSVRIGIEAPGSVSIRRTEIPLSKAPPTEQWLTSPDGTLAENPALDAADTTPRFS